MATIEQRRYNKAPEIIFEYLLDVVSKCGFQITKVEKGGIKRIEVSTGMSLFSFGEKLEIIVGTENLETVVYVKSNAIVPWNLSADTKGKVERIFEELEKFTK